MDRSYSILVVDDEEINIHVVSAALAGEYEIFTSLSGYEAIHLVKERQPDLILLDVMMPDFDGFELCRVIRSEESFAHIPIIFLTAMSTIDGELQGLGSGGIDYLYKPVNLDLLKLKVHNHLELKRRNDLIREQRDQLEAALARVKLLEGIIPICMYCKKIRDDKDNWQQLEKYITEHSEALFSHGLCPQCYEKEMDLIKC